MARLTQAERVENAIWSICSNAYRERCKARKDTGDYQVDEENRVILTDTAHLLPLWFSYAVREAVENGDLKVTFPKESRYDGEGFGYHENAGTVWGEGGSAYQQRKEAREAAEALLAETQGV